jgi:transcriptional regulator with XRE-family HTH domain
VPSILKYVEDSKMNMENMALRIREAMHERNMTQATLIELTEIPKSTLTRILHDGSDPSFDQIYRIAGALGMSIDQLCGRVQNEEVPESASVEMADNAMNAYAELISAKDAQLIEKEKLIESLYGQLERYGRVIDTLTRQLDAVYNK